MNEMEIDIPEQHQDGQPGLEHEMVPQPIYIRNDYRGSGKLAGKKALITGGDSGIGRAVAIHFAREGADVAIFYHPREEEDAQKTKELIEAEGQKALLFPGNLRDAAYIKSAVDQVATEFGAINVLVNNAANHVPQEDFTDITDEQLIDTFEINIIGIFRVTKVALPHMKAGDNIINTTSVTSYRGSETLVDYSSTKGAVTAFTRSLSQNLVEKGIRVNGVAPGPIYTPLIASSLTPEKVAKFGHDTPMERPGQPAELAPAYVLLASDSGSYMTGQVIHVNGGSVVNS